MDISKVPNEEKLKLCKWYFKAGFALLPFVWAVNFVWFFNDAFRKPLFEQQRSLRTYASLSGIGALVWIIALTVWISIFQSNRAEWGEFADRISFIIPAGRV